MAGDRADAAREELLAVDQAWAKAWSALDLEAWSEVLAADAVFLVLGRPALRGAETIRREIGAVFSQPGFATTVRVDDACVAESGDFGYTLGAYVSSLGEGQSHEGKYLAVWRRTAASWKLAAFSSTPS